MRVAIVTESFLPQVNGVTVSVQRLTEQLRARGHEVLVVAPDPDVTSWAGARVVGVPSVPLPGYAGHRVARPWPPLASTLRGFAPDLVHLASPAVLGAQAVVVAERLGVPCVAVYQTDLASYAALYKAPGTARAVWRWLRWIHSRAAITLAPSTRTVADLTAHGIPDVRWWPRGVDLERFHPLHRDPALHDELAGGARTVVGYVGRLAAEKHVHLLSELDRDPDVQVVVVGDGPVRGALERELPRARFLGVRSGDRLAALYASFDVFVHTGPFETFCQAAQEALASGVPVVAPAAGGLPDLVTPGRTGYLYPPGSAAELTEAVRRLAADPVLRGAMGRAARESVLARTWSAVTDLYLEHVDELVPAPSRERSA